MSHWAHEFDAGPGKVLAKFPGNNPQVVGKCARDFCNLMACHFENVIVAYPTISCVDCEEIAQVTFVDNLPSAKYGCNSKNWRVMEC